jgi:hypothetical protein
MREPAPVVLLLGFTNSDMTFELHFWIKLESLIESRTVESQVRTAVCAALQGTDAATTPPAAHTAAQAPAKDHTLPEPGLVAAAVALAVTQKTEPLNPRLPVVRPTEPPLRKAS